MPNNLSDHKNILLFGGSFDPPHRAHVALPQQAAQAIGADLIAYIPAGLAPHKLDRQQTAPHHRLAMLRLALNTQTSGIPTAVLTEEIERAPGEPSYTVDTLETLSQRIDPGAKLRLLIGADQLRIFDSWREPRRVIGLAEPVVMVRPPDTIDKLLDSLPDDQRAAWEHRLIQTDQMDVSSTDIRTQAASGRLDEQHICAAVVAYIRNHGLYQG